MSNIFDDEELAKYDCPREDDDDVDEGIDWEKEDTEAKQEVLKNKMNNTTNVFQGINPVGTQQSPWGQPQPTASPWGSTQPQFNPWGQQQRPVTPPFGGNTWGNNGGTWNNSPFTPRPAVSPVVNPFAGTTSGNQTQQYILPRDKKVIFCDVMDVLTGSIDAGGKLGVPPRGIYDMYLRYEVFERFRCIGARWIYVLTSKELIPGTDPYRRYVSACRFVCAALSEYLMVPYDNCIGVVRSTIKTEMGTELIKSALKDLSREGITKENCLVTGVRSGFQNQANIDSLIAKEAGVDYIDTQLLLTLYK